MDHTKATYDPPTPYRISTITATGSVGTSINLDILYGCLETSCDPNAEEGIVYVEYGRRKSEMVFKGHAKKYTINRRKEKPNRRFDNQVTIVYRTIDNHNLNIKMFRNGNIQITGIKSIEQGHLVVDKLIDVLRDTYLHKNSEVIGSVEELKNTEYKIRLINTDYRIGFCIKRDILHRILKNEFGMVCNYEPVIYPGVKLHYFYNNDNYERDGICKCSCDNCFDNKGGEGVGDGHCKKITIAIFQSGCIIITGSQTRDQIQECYDFINKVLYSNVNRIEKKMMVPQQIEAKPKRIVRILKSNIRV
jgi:TATA-box binding protein (TBP) (component of TFIID and TFIIIB)